MDKPGTVGSGDRSAEPSRREVLWLMLGACLLIFLRTPLLLVDGRIICEEGTVYFQQAWNGRWTESLLAVHQGYYSLFMNAVSLCAARILPLEDAARVMTTASLLVLLLTVYLAITCEAFASRRARRLAALICIITPAIEIWMTAECAQFVLVVAAALVCVSSAERHRLIRTATLVLSGFSGPAACVFTPFFLFRAYKARTLWTTVQATVMTLASLLEGSLLLASLHGGERHAGTPGKWYWFGATLVEKIFSVELATRAGALASRWVLDHHRGVAVCLLFWLLAGASLASLWRLSGLGGYRARALFWLALTSLIFNFAGIGEDLPALFAGTFRYFYTGSVLFGFIFILAFEQTRNLPSAASYRRLSSVLLGLVLFSGLLDAVGYWNKLQYRDPRWSDEVRVWRQDPRYTLRTARSTWPDRIHLDPR